MAGQAVVFSILGFLLLCTECLADSSCSCPCKSTGRRCISDCRGLPDGDYQSCGCCHGPTAYVSCVAGILYRRPCPANLVWADDAKICNYTSKTCKECAQALDARLDDPYPCDCPCTSTGPTCIKSCVGRKDGDYQSCGCCHGKVAYVTCSNGLFYNRPCPADLVWDDNAKLCNWTSRTCHECDVSKSKFLGYVYEGPQQSSSSSSSQQVDEPAAAAAPTENGCPCKKTGRRCITSCTGLPDGDYQSCKCCHGYVSCTAGQMSIYRPCPANLVWDDVEKRCEGTSSTCRECARQGQDEVPSPPQFEPQSNEDKEPEPEQEIDDHVTSIKCPCPTCPCRSTGRACILSCAGLPDGDYQYCKCCRGYVSCSDGQLIPRPCPKGPNGTVLVWADNTKRCNYTSSTCRECVRARSEHPDPGVSVQSPPAPDKPCYCGNCPCNHTGPTCISSCTNLPDGNYQSCNCCTAYLSCVGERLFGDRPCPAGLVWADDVKQCNYTSSTCHECVDKLQKQRNWYNDKGSSRIRL